MPARRNSLCKDMKASFQSCFWVHMLWKWSWNNHSHPRISCTHTWLTRSQPILICYFVSTLQCFFLHTCSSFPHQLGVFSVFCFFFFFFRQDPDLSRHHDALPLCTVVEGTRDMLWGSQGWSLPCTCLLWLLFSQGWRTFLFWTLDLSSA